MITLTRVILARGSHEPVYVARSARTWQEALALLFEYEYGLAPPAHAVYARDDKRCTLRYFDFRGREITYTAWA